MGMAATDPQFHVLAVDDSLIDRKLIERLLKTSSYQVTTVDSGSKALEVLDYCMPGMTGYDLLKKIKESSYLRNIPVVIMSSENVPSRINRCLEEGAEEFFLKPVRLSDVNKLRPHIMKTKNCDDVQKPENKENQENEESKEEKQSDNIVINNNKRKSSMDEELSSDGRRPRYNGSFTVMTN
ncbi:hypothetical protein BUALT_Bualt12G0029700 [Buddleja alternifolia]|uniref:Response regulatory domain-containing protein n=1 Tax=Buddleja alternifolia TaxID=168488 RepID=A0AAV6WPS2_9LAMI|nr:hypothetical protein BUALT_Bualt12G0029700 [Buddleja alternifolia]